MLPPRHIKTVGCVFGTAAPATSGGGVKWKFPLRYAGTRYDWLDWSLVIKNKLFIFDVVEATLMNFFLCWMLKHSQFPADLCKQQYQVKASAQMKSGKRWVMFDVDKGRGFDRGLMISEISFFLPHIPNLNVNWPFCRFLFGKIKWPFKGIWCVFEWLHVLDYSDA